MLTNKFPMPDQISRDIERDGLDSYPHAIDPAVIGSIRDFWLDYFTSARAECEFVRGSLVLGEKNFLSYSETPSWKLYRYSDFIWNEPIHEPTRGLALKVHRRRNIAQGFDPEKGLSYDPSCYGMYVSISYYVPEGGWFETHIDGHQDTPILHHKIPITFAGQNYESGGLFALDRAGAKIDLEKDSAPGSLLFFDGRQRHGVDPIETSTARPNGRLALFAIPTFFENDAQNSVDNRNRKIRYRALASRIKTASLRRRKILIKPPRAGVAVVRVQRREEPVPSSLFAGGSNFDDLRATPKRLTALANRARMEFFAAEVNHEGRSEFSTVPNDECQIITQCDPRVAQGG